MPILFDKVNKCVLCDEIIEDDNGITTGLLPFTRVGDICKIHVKELIETADAIEIKFSRSSSTFRCRRLTEEEGTLVDYYDLTTVVPWDDDAALWQFFNNLDWGDASIPPLTEL